MRHFFKKDKETRIAVSAFLNLAITFVEVGGAVFSGSLSLISDALHNFSDAASLIVSFIALKLVRRSHTEKHTFGYKRAEILAALLNASVLVVVSVFLFKEAVRRFIEPVTINGVVVIYVALVGLAANLIGVVLLRKDSHDNINIKSAYLHLVSDAMSSVAVIMGGACIYLFKIYWIDPLLTVLIGLYVLKEGFHLVGESIHILMQNTPHEINLREIKQAIEGISEVKDIHHVHVWSITEHDIHFEAHVNVKTDMKLSSCCALKEKLESILKERFNINHTTLQFEYESCKITSLINP